jgi:hypothetical protein
MLQRTLHSNINLYRYMKKIAPTKAEIALLELLQSEAFIKVGFGLKSDSRQVYAKLGVQMRAGVGQVLKQRFAKSRHVATTNWSQPQLTPQQILYAANDAYAALKVLEALALPREALPIMGMPSPGRTPWP